jgi:hypothetical protein
MSVSMGYGLAVLFALNAARVVSERPTCGGAWEAAHIEMLRADDPRGETYALICLDGRAWFRHGAEAGRRKVMKVMGAWPPPVDGGVPEHPGALVTTFQVVHLTRTVRR